MTTINSYAIDLIMKLTKTQENKLLAKVKHLTGECMCSPNSKTCPYWNKVDKGGEDWQAKAIIQEIKKL